MTSELHTAELRQLLDRLHGGDPQAIEELLRRAAGRLERLARGTLRNFPQVRQREQTADVLQEAMLSLAGALRQVPFTSTREFYGLAAEHIRRRLVDLSRYHGRAHRDCVPLEADNDRPEQIAGADDLDVWQALHETVAELPTDQREVFSLRLYHGWTVEEVAELLQLTPRTVIRLWMRAQVHLTRRIGIESLPGEATR